MSSINKKIAFDSSSAKKFEKKDLVKGLEIGISSLFKVLDYIDKKVDQLLDDPKEEDSQESIMAIEIPNFPKKAEYDFSWVKACEKKDLVNGIEILINSIFKAKEFLDKKLEQLIEEQENDELKEKQNLPKKYELNPYIVEAIVKEIESTIETFFIILGLLIIVSHYLIDKKLEQLLDEPEKDYLQIIPIPKFPKRTEYDYSWVKTCEKKDLIKGIETGINYIFKAKKYLDEKLDQMLNAREKEVLKDDTILEKNNDYEALRAF